MGNTGIGVPLAIQPLCPVPWQVQGWNLRNPHLVAPNIYGQSPFCMLTGSLAHKAGPGCN